MVIGHTTGIYNLFYIGHLNLLKNAKGFYSAMISEALQVVWKMNLKDIK